MRAVSSSRERPRAAAIGYLIAAIFAQVVAQSGFAASGEASSVLPAAAPSDQSSQSVIVVGFLGGFVPRDERHHPEVQMMQALREEYSQHVYFGLFENRKVGEAYNAILSRLGAKEGPIPDDRKRSARILLFGHSWGASSVVALSRRLARVGIPVVLTVQVDSITKPFHNDGLIPSNVLQAVNFYQTRGLIHGRSRIVAADPSRTTILGNFLVQNDTEPVECRDFSWYAKFFTKSHIEIECDPKVWAQVKTLLRSNLPASAITGTGSGKSAPSLTDESNGIPRGAARRKTS
jgi:hypothetical protein